MSGGSITTIGYLACSWLCGMWMVNQWHRDPNSGFSHWSDYMISLCPLMIMWPLLLATDLIEEEVRLYRIRRPRPQHRAAREVS